VGYRRDSLSATVWRRVAAAVPEPVLARVSVGRRASDPPHARRPREDQFAGTADTEVDAAIIEDCRPCSAGDRFAANQDPATRGASYTTQGRDGRHAGSQYEVRRDCTAIHPVGDAVCISSQDRNPSIDQTCGNRFGGHVSMGNCQTTECSLWRSRLYSLLGPISYR
jgi:hypothetical protein